MNARGLRALSIATVASIAAALAMVFFYAPEEASQGFLQKIFYVHVPLAIVCLLGFMAAGVMAIQHLRSGESRWDLRSYVAIHMSLIFGVGVLITGSIWAKGSWGHWWVWSSPTLVSFLIIVLLYATYQPLRFAIEDPERQARYASVFAIAGGAFVPLSYIAVQMSSSYLHPRVLGPTYDNLPGSMMITFLVALIGFALLFIALWRLEIAAKQARWHVRALRRRLTEQPERARRSAAPSLGVGPSRAGAGHHPPAPALAGGGERQLAGSERQASPGIERQIA